MKLSSLVIKVEPIGGPSGIARPKSIGPNRKCCPTISPKSALAITIMNISKMWLSLTDFLPSDRLAILCTSGRTRHPRRISMMATNKNISNKLPFLCSPILCFPVNMMLIQNHAHVPLIMDDDKAILPISEFSNFRSVKRQLVTWKELMDCNEATQSNDLWILCSRASECKKH